MEESDLWDGEEPFGEMAVRLGYCRAEDVREALNLQHELRAQEGEEKLIGMILMDKGLLTLEQVISILRILEHQNGRNEKEAS